MLVAGNKADQLEVLLLSSVSSRTTSVVSETQVAVFSSNYISVERVVVRGGSRTWAA